MQTVRKYEPEFERTPDGGLIEVGAQLPSGSTAQIFEGAIVFKEAAEKMYGGVFFGGMFHDGVFRGGCFYGGVFRGGYFYGGVFHDGEFHSGMFHDGVFRGGCFYGGVFRGGKFHGGVFRGGHFYGGMFHDGEFRQSPCCALRSDGYMFVAKYVGDDLRIWAGCRNFSWEEAVAHWNDDHERGAESQRIIHFLRAQAEAERDRDAEKS